MVRRALRIVGWGATGLLACAFALACVLWSQSYTAGTRVWARVEPQRLLGQPTYWWEAWSSDGRMVLMVERETEIEPRLVDPSWVRGYWELSAVIDRVKRAKFDEVVGPTWHGFAGFYDRERTPPAHLVNMLKLRQTGVTAPWWAAAVVLGIVPAVVGWRVARRRWRARATRGRSTWRGVARSAGKALMAGSTVVFVLIVAAWVTSQFATVSVSGSLGSSASITSESGFSERSTSTSFHGWRVAATRDRACVFSRGPTEPLGRPWADDGRRLTLVVSTATDGREFAGVDQPAGRVEWLGVSIDRVTRAGRLEMEEPEDLFEGEMGPPRPVWSPPRESVEVLVPYWMPLTLTAIAPAAWARGYTRRRRAARRASANQCAACGYDLRASRERCPECGRATSESTSPA